MNSLSRDVSVIAVVTVVIFVVVVVVDDVIVAVRGGRRRRRRGGTTREDLFPALHDGIQDHRVHAGAGEDGATDWIERKMMQQ